MKQLDINSKGFYRLEMEPSDHPDNQGVIKFITEEYLKVNICDFGNFEMIGKWISEGSYHIGDFPIYGDYKPVEAVKPDFLEKISKKNLSENFKIISSADKIIAEEEILRMYNYSVLVDDFIFNWEMFSEENESKFWVTEVHITEKSIISFRTKYSLVSLHNMLESFIDRECYHANELYKSLYLINVNKFLKDVKKNKTH